MGSAVGRRDRQEHGGVSNGPIKRRYRELHAPDSARAVRGKDLEA